MRASDIRRFCTTFRMAVEAVLYNKIPGREVAMADLQKALAAFRETQNIEVTGCDVPPSFILLVVSSVRFWCSARTDALREALTGCTIAQVDALAKWIDGELVTPRDAAAELNRAIGGR